MRNHYLSLLPDGSVARTTMPPEASEEEETRLWNKTKAELGIGVFQIVDEGDLPYHLFGNGDPVHGSCLDPDCHDRYFRDALMGFAMVVDMPKARVIHMASARRARTALLAVADFEINLADDTGVGDVVKLRQARQVLRDMPVEFQIVIDAIDNPEDLKASWPVALPERV